MDEKLITENIKLVHFMIHKHFRFDPGEYEDIFQIGCIGLCKAAKAYNANQSAFSTFAAKCIYCEIACHFRNRRTAGRNGETISLDAAVIDDGKRTITLADMLEDEKAESFANNDIEFIHSFISNIKNPRDKQIFYDYIINGMKQRELAGKYKVRQASISRILKKIKQEIRKEYWRS